MPFLKKIIPRIDTEKDQKLQFSPFSFIFRRSFDRIRGLE